MTLIRANSNLSTRRKAAKAAGFKTCMETPENSVRRGKLATRMRPDFGGGSTLAPFAIAHQNDLAGPELGHAEAPERLHVHKDIRRTFAARQKAEAAYPVEPLDHGSFPVALGLYHDVRALGKLRWMDRGAFIHAEDLERLHTFRAFQHLAVDARPLVGGLEAASAQTGHVEQNIGQAAKQFF